MTDRREPDATDRREPDATDRREPDATEPDGTLSGGLPPAEPPPAGTHVAGPPATRTPGAGTPPTGLPPPESRPDGLEATQPVELDADGTQPVGVTPRTGPFAPAEPPAIPLVSTTAANMLLADALPPTAAPEPSVPDPTSGLDALFAEDRFRDYDAPPHGPTRHPDPAPARQPASASQPASVRLPTPSPPPASRPPKRVDPPHTTRTQRVLLGIAGGLVALVVLVALFFVGTRLPDGGAPTPSANHARRTPTPTPVATVLPPGPVAVGVHRWDRLLGGECLGDFTSPWAERFTVVDCASPHPAQLVHRGWLPDPATPGYPGQQALQAQLPALCSAPGVIDLEAASRYTDVQLQASYPATAAQWDAGDHWYYCFVTRSSREPLTGSVAAVRPAG